MMLEQRAAELGERLRLFVLIGLALLAVVLAGGQLGSGVTGVVALLAIAAVVAVVGLLPRLLARGAGTTRGLLLGRGPVPPLPRVSEPDAAGQVRPRAPGGASAR